ncbi:MAG: 1-deoxy-D-xylulose-5-phosphate synthase [Mogibacterium sp.]|nr:1-deoxy-D-xylulose-5-phosphate synthase [Mogibacterium sp.]
MYFDFYKDDLISIIKKASYEDLNILAGEMREFILDKVSKTGGHLASNLGIVELTIALHRVYDTGRDRLIWDVGHQSYVHKIITGRASGFDSLRQYKGLSGFPKSRESIHDAYDTGHSSTSLSAASGIAAARDLQQENYDVIAVIGDGSMTGGLVYEALNNIGESRRNIRIILNDNGMSIARNVGGMSKHLNNLRTSFYYQKAKSSIRSSLDNIPVVGPKMSDGISRTKDKIKLSLIDEEGILFEQLGVKYIGPVDGYNIESMVSAFEAANKIDGPTLVHVITTKGKGYYWSQKYPRKFHGVGPFNRETGELLKIPASPSYSKVFGEKLTELAFHDQSIAAVCAAMGTATGLGPFWKHFEERFFDVGIAESHAVVFAAGLAKGGMKPVVAIYSSFLQRAYDQLLEDICLQNLHVVFAIDRAGLVGADGETHHGQFDLSYLNSIPNMTVLCPADGKQLEEMLEYALYRCEGPVAIRYPRGESGSEHLRLRAFNGEDLILSEGSDVTLLAVGAMLDEAIAAAELLRAHGINVGVTDVTVAKPAESPLTVPRSRLVVTIEDNVLSGGYGSVYNTLHLNSGSHILNIAIPDAFIEQGNVAELRDECGISASHIAERVLREYRKLSSPEEPA